MQHVLVQPRSGDYIIIPLNSASEVRVLSCEEQSSLNDTDKMCCRSARLYIREREDTRLHMCISPSNYEGVISDKGLTKAQGTEEFVIVYSDLFIYPLSKNPT